MPKTITQEIDVCADLGARKQASRRKGGDDRSPRIARRRGAQVLVRGGRSGFASARRYGRIGVMGVHAQIAGALPTGVVTFLLTDVEDSARLWHWVDPAIA